MFVYLGHSRFLARHFEKNINKFPLKKEVGVMVNDLVFWLTVWLNFENVLLTFK